MAWLTAACLVMVSVSALAVLLVFALYPTALFLRARAARTGIGPAVKASVHDACPTEGREPFLPTVSVVTAVRDGETLIAEKLQNTFALDYPRDRLEIVCASDGSTDRTNAILEAASDRGVKAVILPDHEGKTAALNASVRQCTGDILVLTDADARLEPDAVRRLVRPLRDPAVGGVCGQRIIGEHSATRHAQSHYIELDSVVKRLESERGSLTSNDGKLYAVRRNLFPRIPPAVTDDLYVCLHVVRNRYRFVHEPLAAARIRLPSRGMRHELTRRRRIVGRGLRGIRHHRALLNPGRYGFYAVGLLVNKVLRRLLPLAMISFLLGTVLLAPRFMWARLLCFAQLTAYGAAALSPLFPRALARALPGRLCSVLRYACVGNAGTLLGLIDFLTGRRLLKWDPVKESRDAAGQQTREGDGGPPAVACIMSRFPKITETFILNEILCLEAEGLSVCVYPLLRQREPVEQPDVRRLRGTVRYLPFLSASVIASNVAYAIRSPGTYFRMMGEAFAGTWRSANFFVGMLGILPKSVRAAAELKRRGVGHVHAQFATHAALSALIIHRLTGIPFSFTGHGSDLHVDQHMLRRKLEACRFGVTISEYNKRFMLQACGEDLSQTIHVIHCGVDPEVFRPAEHRDTSGPVRFLCVASLRDVKGHRHLLDALSLLAGRGHAFTCGLVGDGPLHADIRARVQALGLQERVVLHGALTHPDVLRLTQQADASVLTSVMGRRGNREGIPVTLMEAMACGLPVVASRISGIPELVRDGETGLLCEPGNADDIAVALERIIADPDFRRTAGQAGRARVVEDFHLAHNSRELAELLRASLAVKEARA